jgi:hypothetical protein
MLAGYCVGLSRYKRSGNGDTASKWLEYNQKLEYIKIMNCMNRIHVINLGKYSK